MSTERITNQNGHPSSQKLTWVGQKQQYFKTIFKNAIPCKIATFLTLRINLPPLTFFIFFKRSDKCHFIFQTRRRLLVGSKLWFHCVPLSRWPRASAPPRRLGALLVHRLQAQPFYASPETTSWHTIWCSEKHASRRSASRIFAVADHGYTTIFTSSLPASQMPEFVTRCSSPFLTTK